MSDHVVCIFLFVIQINILCNVQRGILNNLMMTVIFQTVDLQKEYDSFVYCEPNIYVALQINIHNK